MRRRSARSCAKTLRLEHESDQDARGRSSLIVALHNGYCVSWAWLGCLENAVWRSLAITDAQYGDDGMSDAGYPYFLFPFSGPFLEQSSEQSYIFLKPVPVQLSEPQESTLSISPVIVEPSL